MDLDPQPGLDDILSALNMIEDQQYLDPETDADTPRTWDEAQNSPGGLQWEQSYQEELDSLNQMGIWRLVPQEDVPWGHQVLKGCPVFTIKHDENGKVTRFKMHHVVQGFNQIYGRDYTCTTSPNSTCRIMEDLVTFSGIIGLGCKSN